MHVLLSTTNCDFCRKEAQILQEHCFPPVCARIHILKFEFPKEIHTLQGYGLYQTKYGFHVKGVPQTSQDYSPSNCFFITASLNNLHPHGSQVLPSTFPHFLCSTSPNHDLQKLLFIQRQIRWSNASTYVSIFEKDVMREISLIGTSHFRCCWCYFRNKYVYIEYSLLSFSFFFLF